MKQTQYAGSRPWLDTLTIAVFSPFLRRDVLISPLQYRLMVVVFGGWQGTQRDLAAQTGYTVGGVNDALKQLRRLGLVVVRTVRGCRGSTVARVRRGAKVVERGISNVRQRLSSIRISTSTSKRISSSVGEHSARGGPKRVLREPGRAW